MKKLFKKLVDMCSNGTVSVIRRQYVTMTPKERTDFRDLYELATKRKPHMRTRKQKRTIKSYEAIYGKPRNNGLSVMELAVYKLADPALGRSVELCEPDAVAEMESLMDLIEIEARVLVERSSNSVDDIVQQTEEKLTAMIDGGTFPDIIDKWHEE